MLSPRQMSTIHSLKKYSANITCYEEPLKRDLSIRLLGVQLDQNLSWREHITNISSSCYATLSVLRKLRNFAPFHIQRVPNYLCIFQNEQTCQFFPILRIFPEYFTKITNFFKRCENVLSCQQV